MNSQPYSTAASSKSRTDASPFAREVYRNEEPRDPRADVLEEIAALRAEVRTEVRALRGVMGRPRPNVELTTEIAALRAAVDELLATPKRCDAFASLLRSRGIEGGAAAALAKLGNAGAKSKKKTGPGTPAEVAARFANAIATLVTTSPWPIAADEPTVIALVGPAGVGKTTTAAKLGARARRAKKTVAFVSCDGYRVGAMDQLRRYAELMDSEFHAVNSAEELVSVVSSISADVIIIDTSGRAVEAGSVEAMLGGERMRGEANGGRKLEVMLCVPAALRAADAARIARDFAAVGPTSLCVTKLDETDAPSALVHATFATKLPIGTLCFGQRVPEDIASATIEDVVARLVPPAQDEP